MTKWIAVAAGVALIFAAGCWETVDHVYDEGNILPTETESDTLPADTDTVDSASDSASDTETATGNDAGNSMLNADWRGFGTACADAGACDNYAADNKRCIHDVMQIINAPAGYCTACCNEPGTDRCGPGVDCVGVEGAYLVCLARCGSNDDCRTEDHWECRQIYYIPDQFPANYCLPDEEHVTPEAQVPEPMECPWPWN